MESRVCNHYMRCADVQLPDSQDRHEDNDVEEMTIRDVRQD